jgi:hypothetical protein
VRDLTHPGRTIYAVIEQNVKCIAQCSAFCLYSVITGLKFVFPLKGCRKGWYILMVEFYGSEWEWLTANVNRKDVAAILNICSAIVLIVYLANFALVIAIVDVIVFIVLFFFIVTIIIVVF